ncbi:MAG: hypothetical protein GX790_01950 [Syntrophomonadaceae bacterium]|nr:hypothetical protein [Syntrophomonadaceae bacterium]
MIIAIIVFLLLSLISFYPLLIKKNWRELIVGLFILLTACLFAVQYQIGFNLIPTPGDFITELEPLAKKLLVFFELTNRGN